MRVIIAHQVRFGSGADLEARTGHVRFAAHSGHAQRRTQGGVSRSRGVFDDGIKGLT